MSTTRIIAMTTSTAALTLALPAAAQETTITIATHYNDAQMEPLTACFRQYEEENPGLAIEHQQASYRDFLQTILTARVGGTSPDIYNIYSIWAPQLAAAGVLAEPPEEVAATIREGYGEGTVGAATIGGTLYGFPTELSVYQLVYNRTLLEEAGYSEPPATWAELKEAAAAITQTNDQGNITVAGYTYGPTEANAVHPFFSQLYAAGVQPFGEDFRTSNVDDPTAVEILSKQAELFEEGITSTAVETDDFAAGGAAMAIMANWNKSAFQDAFGDAFADTVGVAPIPHDGGEGGTMLYSFFWAVDASSDVTDEAWALLSWLNTAQEGQEMSCTGQMLAALGALTGNLADLEAMDTDDPFTAPFVEAVESGAAVSQPNVWQSAEIERILRASIEQVWAGRVSAEDALAQADAEIQSILDEQPEG
jgi:multiple sugar transport system substrate-binding protein